MAESGLTPVAFSGMAQDDYFDDPATGVWSTLAGIIGRPKAIICVRHWCTEGVKSPQWRLRGRYMISAGATSQLFEVQYRWSAELARLIQKLQPIRVELDHTWGLDHATWTVLSVIYPQADVPVVQLSMDASKPIAWHYEVGRALRPLREEGFLILGSGNVVHTLAQMEWDIKAKPHDWAERFNDLVIDVVETNTPERLFNHEALGQDAALSIHPLILAITTPILCIRG